METVFTGFHVTFLMCVLLQGSEAGETLLGLLKQFLCSYHRKKREWEKNIPRPPSTFLHPGYFKVSDPLLGSPSSSPLEFFA